MCIFVIAAVYTSNMNVEAQNMIWFSVSENTLCFSYTNKFKT